MRWPSFLMFDGSFDGIARVLSVLILGVIIVKYSSIFEEEYTKKLTNLYLHPWWRFLVILLVLLSTMWCPRVGIIMALLVFFYFSDMEVLITPFSTL